MLTALGLLGVVALIAANGYFVAVEFAFVAARRSRFLEQAEEGDRRSKRAIDVHRRLSFMLSGAQLGITVTTLLVGFIAEPAIASVIEPALIAVTGEAAIIAADTRSTRHPSAAAELIFHLSRSPP